MAHDSPEGQTFRLAVSGPQDGRAKIKELAKRGEAAGTSEARQMLDHGIESGRGGCYLNLTPAQYAKLRRP